MRNFLGILIFLVGAGIFFYPTAMSELNKRDYKEYNIEFQNTKKKNKFHPEEYQDLRMEMEKYNKEIFLNGQEGFKDAWSVTKAPVTMRGYNKGKFGIIKIPSIKAKLPLYIGATEENMSHGAVILGYTSMPIGGVNTNSVIAAHRGYQGIPFFREIESVKVGDKVIVDNIWERLTYKVTEIKIIVPDDSDQCKIQPGKDMLTLMTCHPYRSRGKFRYLLYCQRTNGKNEKIKTKKNVTITEGTEFIPSDKDIQREKMVRLAAGIFILLCSLKIILPARKKKKKS